MMFELESVLKCGYYETPKLYDNVSWCANEILKLEK